MRDLNNEDTPPIDDRGEDRTPDEASGPSKSPEVVQAALEVLETLMREAEQVQTGEVLEPQDDQSSGNGGKAAQREIRAILSMSTRRHRGPLPDSQTLAEYKAIDPDFPREILAMAKKEQDHRHSMNVDSLGLQRMAVQEEARQIARGQWLGFGVLGIVLAVAILFAVLGYPGIAAIVAGVDVVALVALFVTGQKTARDLREDESSESSEK